MSEMAEIPSPDSDEFQKLVQTYIEKQELEAAQSEEETRRVTSFFEAGTRLRVLKALNIYDPIEHHTVSVPMNSQLEVADYEGDIIIGQMADNSHSVGVIYEEPERWYKRKYFLPLGTLFDKSFCEIDRSHAVDFVEGVSEQVKGSVKGFHESAKSDKAAIAIRRIEELQMADEYALLPQGAILTLRHGAHAINVANGKEVFLRAGREVEIIESVASAEDAGDYNKEFFQVRWKGQNYSLSFRVLDQLDIKTDLRSIHDQELEQQRLRERREFLKLGLIGGGAVAAAGGKAYYIGSLQTARMSSGMADTADFIRKRRAAAAIAPELGLMYSLFRSGNKYWWDLRGALYNLIEQKVLELAKTQSSLHQRVASASSLLYSSYSGSYYRTVHTGWSETRHYRTDKDGNRHYTHSTWSKTYSSLWVEPGALSGFHTTLSSWENTDSVRSSSAKGLLSNRIFNLIEADRQDPEKSYKLEKMDYGAGKDFAISAFFMVICLMPPAFYDDLLAAANGDPYGGRSLHPRNGFGRYQKESLAAVSLLGSVYLAERQHHSLQKLMKQNKYDLGETLERQVRRVPGLSFESAYKEYFGLTPEGLVSSLESRTSSCRGKDSLCSSFSYTYGSGWDNGRPLDSIYVDGSSAASGFLQYGPRFAGHAESIDQFYTTEVRQRLTALMQNAVGTRLLEAQISEDQSEVSTGIFKQSLAFSAPVWGAALLDIMIKMMRA